MGEFFNGEGKWDFLEIIGLFKIILTRGEFFDGEEKWSSTADNISQVCTQGSFS